MIGRRRTVSIWPLFSKLLRTCPGGLPLVLSALVAGGCGKPLGQYVWVEEYTAPAESEYLIVPGDVLRVRVYKEDALSGNVRVRTDGKVSLPLLDDVPAAGRTTSALARDLENRLKAVVMKPVVSVSLEETRNKQFSVIGEVSRPGIYALEPGLGVLQALANAGGLNEFANRDRIFVLRAGNERARIRFNYDQLTRGEESAAGFLLQPGDVIVVE